MSQVNHRARLRRTVTLLAAGCCSLVLSGLAQAEDPSPTPPRSLPPAAGIGQYVEDVPSAAGPRAAGRPATRGAALSQAARKQLSKVDAPTRRVLKRIATAPEYGAPVATAATQRSTARGKGATTARPGRTARAGRSDRAKARDQEPSAAAAAASAVSGDDNGNLGLFLLGLALITLAAVGASIVRFRRGRAV